MDAQLDPYRDWLGIAEPRRPLTYYQLLELTAFESDAAVIESAAERQLLSVREFVKGEYSRLARRTIFELESARKCLLDDASKRAYDESLRSGVVAKSSSDGRGAAEPDVSKSAKPRPDPQPQIAKAKSPPAVTSASAVAELLDEEMPVQAAPEVPCNLAALQLPVRQKPRNETRRNAIMVVAVIGVPIVVVLAVAYFVVSFIDSRLASGGPSLRENPGSTEPEPPALDGPRPVRRQQDPPASPTQPTVPWSPPPGPFGQSAPSTTNPPNPFAAPPVGAAPVPSPLSPLEPNLENPALPKRSLPPDGGAVATATQKLRSRFGKEFQSAQTPAEKSALTEKLLNLADAPQTDSTSRYAILQVARDLAIEAGNAPLFAQSVDAMALSFEIEPLASKFAGLCRMFALEQPAESRRAVIQVATMTAYRLADVDRYDEAVKLAQLSFDAARQLADATLVKFLGRRAKELVNSQTRFTAARHALSVLHEHPDDPLANQQVGEWYWYDKHDPERGFRYLVKASNNDLRAAVAQEMELPQDPIRQLALANAWWDIAHDAEDGERRSTILRQSLHWYRNAHAQIPDAKSVAYNRIVEFERDFGSKRVPALVVDLSDETTRLPIGDEELPQGSAIEIEIVKLTGLSPTPPLPAGPKLISSGSPLRLPLHNGDPRVEIRFQAMSVNGKCLLSVMPVFVEAPESIIPFTDARISTLATRLSDAVENTNQRLASVNEQIQSLQIAGNNLTNYVPTSAAEDAQKTVRLQEMQNDLKRLVIQQKSIARALAPLQRRLAMLPALIDLQRKVDRTLAISFRIKLVGKDGTKTFLLETN